MTSTPSADRDASRTRPGNGVAFAVAPWMVLGLSLVLTFCAWWFVRAERSQDEERHFDAVAADIAQRADARFLATEQAVRAAASFVSTSEQVTAADWERFVRGLMLPETTFAGALGIGFVQRVPAGDLPAHLAEMRRVKPDYTIWPEGASSDRFPIVYLCHLYDIRTNSPFGFDSAADASRREAIDRAVATARLAYSRVVTNRPAAGSEGKALVPSGPAFLLYAPAWTPSASGLDVPVSGLAMARIDIGVLLASALPSDAATAITLTTVDTDGRTIAVDTHPGQARLARVMPRDVAVTRGGVAFSLRIAALPSFGISDAGDLILWVPIVGSLASFALFGVVLVLDRQRRTEVADLTAAVDERERRFRDMADTAPFTVWLADTTMWITYLNPAWSESTGLPAGQVTRASFEGALHPEDRPLLDRTARDAIATLADFSVQHRIRHVDGEWHWHLTRGRAIRDRDGRPMGFMGMSIDIQEIKKAEAEREANLSLMQDLVDAIPTPIAVKDGNLRFVYLNTAASEMFGRTPEEVLGLDDFALFPEEDAHRFRERDHAVLSSGQSIRYDVTYAPIRGTRGREGGWA